MSLRQNVDLQWYKTVEIFFMVQNSFTKGLQIEMFGLIDIEVAVIYLLLLYLHSYNIVCHVYSFPFIE